MPEAKLSRRLNAAFLLVKGGGVVADIGTDHALLPIALVKSGKVKSAIASDINKLPLEKARENIEKEGLSDKIKTHLANGAEGLCKMADEFVIAGMGGELIAQIIEASAFLKDKNIHLVLQPMTRIPTLRRYLWENGFSIEKEVYLADMGHFYTVMSVVYTGENTKYTLLDSEIGFGEHRKNLTPESADALAGEINLKLYDLNNKIEGKMRAGLDTEWEKKLSDDLRRALELIERKNV